MVLKATETRPEKTPGEGDPSDRLVLFLLLLLLVVFIQFGLGWAIFKYAGNNWTQRGQFGDMFGAVNTLFSG